MIAIANLQTTSQQCRTITLALAEWLNTDDGQVPVVLVRMTCPHLLEHGKHVFLKAGGRALLHDRAERLLIRADTWRQP